MPVAGIIDASTQPIIVGRRVVNSSLAFHGGIDELRLFNRALAAGEIAASSNAGGLGTCPLPPTVSISGRVMTPAGLGLRNAFVTITDQNGVPRRATTSSFGFYSFDRVRTGENYTIGALSKRYRFAARVVSVSDDLTNVDFTGLE